MILKFPDLDTLKLVLINGAVPPSLSLAPATVGFDEQGPVWLEPSVTPTRKAQDELKKYGVQVGKKSGTELSAEVSCWLEALPLLRETESVAPPDQTPVLFDLPSGEHLARFSTEILRLGNDRQGYRWLEEKEGATRALLRVVGPPYYSLLRALDARGTQSPRAFVERAPRVWVELGYRHPLADKIKAPEGQMILLRPTRQWTYLPEQPYRDIYDVVDFPLPGVRIGFQDSVLKDRLAVPLRLVRGDTTDAAELWVLREDPIATLNNLVQKSDDELLNRLSFAVGESKGRTIIVLRVRPSKQPPPVIVLDGSVAFRSFLKMPNLFLPIGWGLHPPLRRDVVRKLLTDDNVLTWLYPEDGKGAFTPETISQDVFRPLLEWVDYVIDHDAAALTTWVQSHVFDFESFICDEEGPPKPRKPPPAERGQRGGGKGGGGGPQEVQMPAAKEQTDDSEYRALIEEPVSLVPAAPSEQKIRLDELEGRFLSLEGPLDLPERQAMWPEMAALHAALNDLDNASVCWLNALWSDETPSEGRLWTWFRSEASTVPERTEGRKSSRWTAAVLHAARPKELAGEDLDRLLNLPDPAFADVRALAAYLSWAASRNPVPRELAKRLNAVGLFLEKHERSLPVRAMWLAWSAFARLTGDDVLALARARDRILEHLYDNGGLRPEHDLPGFLRFVGQPRWQQYRGLRQWIVSLCNLILEWSEHSEVSAYSSAETVPNTLAYIQMLFAYGFARVGEHDASTELIDKACKRLKLDDPVNKLLVRMLGFRIKLAQEGKKNAGPFPADVAEEINKLPPMDAYVINRLRQHSQILEPDQKRDPYLFWVVGNDDLGKKLRDASLLNDRKELLERLQGLLKETPLRGKNGVMDRLRVLRTSLEVAPRLGEEFGTECVAHLLAAWDVLPTSSKVQDLNPRVEIMQPALFTAAHFDRKDQVQGLVSRFLALMDEQGEALRTMNDIDRAFGESLRSLRKLGMHDQIEKLLAGMSRVILSGEDLQNLASIRPDKNGLQVLRSMLYLASGWLYFQKDREAEKVITATRAILFGTRPSQEQTLGFLKLAHVYVQAISGLSAEVFKERLEELFHRLPPLRDNRSTSRYFTLVHLDLAEGAVLGVAGDDSAMDADARRWLDDDEFIVRRRIHQDFRTAKAHS